jgi:hypothetical protein
MNKQIIAISGALMLCSSFMSHAMSCKEAHDVFHTISKVTRLKPIFKCSNGKEVNAYTTRSGVIIVTKGLLSFIKTKGELATVIGHEFSHYSHQDLIFHSFGKHPEDELRSDVDGYSLCERIYKNHCLDFPVKMRQQFGDSGDRGVHPSWTYRINNMLLHK